MQTQYKKVATPNGTDTLVSGNCFRLLTSSGSLALIDNASETLFALKPVTFRYRKWIPHVRSPLV